MIKHVPVDELYVQCSYPMRSDAIAMSDCCREFARSAVIDDHNYYLYRCMHHMGLVKPGIFGEVSYTVPRKV